MVQKQVENSQEKTRSDTILPPIERVPIGTVISTRDSPSTSRIDFVLRNENLRVNKGEIVEIVSEERLILARADDIKKINAYYASADSVKEYEASVPSLESIFPTSEWGYVVTGSTPLGELSLSGSQSMGTRIRFPVSPGDAVYRARKKTVSNLLGLVAGGLSIGTIPTAETPLNVDMTKLLRTHLAVLAISGAGKSYTASVLLEELLRRKPEQGRVAVVVIDPHGEYAAFKDTPEFKNKIAVVRGSYMTISVPRLSPWSFREFNRDISPVQIRELTKIINNLRRSKDGQRYDLKDIIREIEDSDSIRSSTKESLLGWMYGLQNTRFFSAEENPDLERTINPGSALVIDLSDLLSLRKKQILVSYLCRRLLDLRRKGIIPPFFLLVEEAHQFVPEGTPAISKSVLETIAREGRKFYACLGLISQRPVRLSSTALSQCNSHLIMRVRNPYDLDFLAKTSEGIDRHSLNALSSLDVGEALLVGNALRHPTFFQVRRRSVEPKRFEEDLEEEARRFEKGS